MQKEFRTQEQINEMRKRLYDRSGSMDSREAHRLTNRPVDVRRDWEVQTTPEKNATDLRSGLDITVDGVAAGDDTPAKKPGRKYRLFVLAGSLFIFVVVAIISSLFLFFGGNQISNDNINIAISGPASIGGGEILSAQIGVSNQNSVLISSATLIVKYPAGTRSVGDDARNMYEERIALTDITPGETQNVPIRAIIFGEENEEKEISATIEYRVDGSNGMFYKDSEPLKFRISSSPLVLRVESISKVASGQLIDVTLTAVSNASAPLNNILISAQYPNGFSFQSSEPEPVFGQNVWRINELLPEQSTTITLRGIITGLTEEALRMSFEAGPAETTNPYLVAATLTDTYTEFTIERPFIDIDIAINGTKNAVAVLGEAESSTVDIEVTNTLDETIYDLAVEVVPGGNALSERSISSGQGFYDSNNETVRWEVANNSSFSQVLPGDSRRLSFVVNPGTTRTTASYNLVVNIYARRVAEPGAQETLMGTAQAEAKYSSSIQLGSQASRNDRSFTDIGPVPPKVGETTSYTLSLVATAGANDMTNVAVNTSLPSYVNWLDAYKGDGDVTYNPVSKQLQWNVGEITSGKQKELTLQLSILPSTSQVNRSPTLLNNQALRANDKFTGALLQESAPAVTTELSTEMGFAEDNGMVER